MTREEREEAIEYLNTLYMALAVFPNQQISLGNVDEMKESVSMAIEALEQEPCEDTISRQAVIDLVVANHTELNGLNVVMYAPFYKDIIQLPPVKPQEPKTGHWEWVQYDYNPKLGNWHCSECRCIVVECVDKEEKGGIPLYKYCPQCGAKMQEAEIEG